MVMITTAQKAEPSLATVHFLQAFESWSWVQFAPKKNYLPRTDEGDRRRKAESCSDKAVGVVVVPESCFEVDDGGGDKTAAAAAVVGGDDDDSVEEAEVRAVGDWSDNWSSKKNDVHFGGDFVDGGDEGDGLQAVPRRRLSPAELFPSVHRCCCCHFHLSRHRRALSRECGP